MDYSISLFIIKIKREIKRKKKEILIQIDEYYSPIGDDLVEKSSDKRALHTIKFFEKYAKPTVT